MRDSTSSVEVFSKFGDPSGSDIAEVFKDGKDAGAANSIREPWNFRVAADGRHALCWQSMHVLLLGVGKEVLGVMERPVNPPILRTENGVVFGIFSNWLSGG